MLENGMIVGAESYDPQCREVAQGKCAHCKQTVPVYELTEFASGERVCRDCEAEYLRLNGADFVEEYIEEHQEEYYREWWWDNLTPSQQLREIKIVYLAQILEPSDADDLAVDKFEFCEESDDFLQFVREKLLNGTERIE